MKKKATTSVSNRMRFFRNHIKYHGYATRVYDLIRYPEYVQLRNINT